MAKKLRLPAKAANRKTVTSKATGKPVDRKRSLAARKAAATRKANQAESLRSNLRWHHKIIAGGAIAAVIVLAFIGIRSQLDTYAATRSAQGLVNGSGQCMDNWGDKKVGGNEIRLNTCNATAAQTWSIHSDGHVVNSDGYCLDTPGTAAAIGDKATLRTCGGANGEMEWTYAGGVLTNKHSGNCLGKTGSYTLDLQKCNGSSAQKWTYKNVTVSYNPAPPMSTKQKLAKEIVGSSKIHFLPGNGASAGARESIFSNIASGKTNGNSLPCGLNIRVLNLIVSLISKHSSIGIGDTNGLCMGVTQGRSHGSRHLAGNGSAVDIYELDGVALTGGNAKSISYLNEIKGSLVKGSTLHNQSQVGQVNCRAHINLGAVSQIDDSCNHVHVDFPPWSDPSLKYESGAF